MIDRSQTALNRLKEVIKVYLMLAGGAENLGSMALRLIDVLDDALTDLEVVKQLDELSRDLVVVLYSSAFERLESFDKYAADTHLAAKRRVEAEAELLPHLLFLKSILSDLGIAASLDTSGMLQKVQEVINSVKPTN